MTTESQPSCEVPGADPRPRPSPGAAAGQETAWCPCGAPAPDPLPGPGSRPASCAQCAAPLVRPGRVPATAIEWGLAAGLVAGAACAYVWMLLPRLAGPAAEHGFTTFARSVEMGAPWAICGAAIVIAWAVRLAARARSPGMQWIAVLAFVVFLCVGEVLLYRNGIRDRLVAMHAAEGAPDPEILGDEEYRSIDFWKYLHIEIGFAWFTAVAIGTWTASFVLRPFRAVAAFVAAPQEAAERPEVPAPADVPGEPAAGAL